MIRVLFICMGNICRSPTAEGVFRHLVGEAGLSGRIEIDSAGTHAYHVGEAPDRRAQVAAKRRGIDLSMQRARAVATEDFSHYDWIVAMDAANLNHLQRNCPKAEREKLALLLDFAPQAPAREVPDPYYGGDHGFEHVLDLVEAGGAGLLAAIRQRHGI
jgi:protein-tyrosine phosphatase